MLIITGGAGFIGSYLAAMLERQELGPIVICDWLGQEQKWRNIAKRTLLDIITPEQLPAFLETHQKSIDTIFHMGAISATTETDGDRIVSNNFRLSKDLFVWCAAMRKRLIYASSAATYGNGALGFDDREDLEHLSALRPLNLYGWSKNAFDRYVALTRQSGDRFPAQCAGLKFFNVYGPNEYHKGGMRSVAHQIYPYAARGETFSLFKSHDPNYADGGQLRDFIWVGDVAYVMIWLYHHPRVNGLFNVGTGEARSFLDLASAVYRAAGREPMIAYRDMPTELQRQYQYFTEASMAKLRKAGYAAPFTSLENGVSQYVRDYLSYEDPYA